MSEPNEAVSVEKKKTPLWLFAILALLVLGVLLYFFWWPIPLEKGYDFKALTERQILSIREGVYEERQLGYELTPKSSFLAARASRALKQAQLQWTSENPAVVQADPSTPGLIRAAEEGKTRILLQYGPFEAAWEVEVYYPLTGLALSEERIDLRIDDTKLLDCAPLPAQAALPGALKWTSSDESVATVSDQGEITALYPGQCLITVEGDGMSASCRIQVWAPMTEMHFERREQALNVGDTEKPTLVFAPDYTTDSKEALWESADSSVATVNPQGVITARGPGHTQIRVQVGDFTDSMELEVFSPLKGVCFEDELIRLLRGESRETVLKLDPANTTDDTSAVYDSSDWSAVNVDENGVVTAVGPGEATITAWVGAFEFSCHVIVRVPMTGIDIDGYNRILSRDESEQLTVSFFPADTNDERTLSWESEDSSVVSVDEDGTVHALKPGSVVITARCGEFEGRLRVTVVIPATGVSISHTEAELKKGESLRLQAAVEPADTTDEQNLYYYSSDNSVATVDGSGVITAVGAGHCQIVASNGKLSASCQLSVIAPLKGISLSESQISFTEGDSQSLSVSFDPWDTTDDRSIHWSSSNEAVARMEGGNVKAVGAGDCTITAQVGGFSASASVHVNPYIWVSSISLSQNSIYFNEQGASRKLDVNFNPGNATNRQVSWTSSDTNVARVDNYGNVVANGSGSCTITAMAEGGATASCQVTAELPVAPVIVVLDPGHGGRWSGAIGVNGTQEKTINLATAYACKDYLEKNYKNVTVIMTRYGDEVFNNSDVGTDIAGRAALANRKGATIVVSLHFNASDNNQGRGTEIYCSAQTSVSGASRALAESIYRQLCGLGFAGRGVFSKRLSQDDGADYYQIIRNSASYGIPAVLVEHCFMDNAQDFAMLNTDQLGVADAIGIANYLGLERK